MTSPQDYARLLDALGEHLARCSGEVDLASVEVTTSNLDGVRATVQLSSPDLAELAAVLLGWADTLTQVTATAWRPSDGDRVHLVLAGRLSDGLALRIYGGVPYVEVVFGADLQPHGRQSVALSVLRTWATGAVAA